MMSKISLIRQVQLKKGTVGCIHLSKLIGDCSLPTHAVFLSGFREILHHLLLMFNEIYPGAIAYFFYLSNPRQFYSSIGKTH